MKKDDEKIETRVVLTAAIILFSSITGNGMITICQSQSSSSWAL
ncbi:hypothetical protein [Candidatus Weimeria sp. HCP3S3_B5]